SLLLILSRLPIALMALQGQVITLDEVLMSQASLDRFLGVPNAEMNWPGGTLLLLMVPLQALAFAIQAKLNPSPQAFLTFLSEAYRSPWQIVFLARMLVITISSVGIASLYFPLAILTQNRTVRVASLLMSGTIPFIWVYSQMATVDALSLGLICASITCLSLRNSTGRIIFAAIMFGFALAAKATFVLALPFLLTILWITSNQPHKELLLYLVLTVLAFAFACPFVWTEPIRLAKAILGLSTQRGEPQNLLEILKLLGQISSLPMLIFFVLGCLNLAIGKQIVLLWGSLLTLALSIAIFSRAHGIVFDRYFMPCWPAFVFLTTAGLELITQRLAQARLANVSSRFLQRSFLVCVAVLVLSNHFSAYAATIRESQQEQETKRQIFRDLKKLNCQKSVMVPFELFAYIAGDTSVESLQQLRADLSRVKAEQTLTSFRSISRKDVDPTIIQYLGQNFNENERSFEARLRIMEFSEPKQKPLDIKLWHRYQRLNDRFGFQSPQQVRESLVKNSICAAILPEKFRVPLGLTGTRYDFYQLVVTPQP
ncbi:MAG: hypothetical protein VKO44_09965, partial [Cyanobacteriota bacterium]|nr:hypothetical protein [Cyanobacteriota bacterium]